MTTHWFEPFGSFLSFLLLVVTHFPICHTLPITLTGCRLKTRNEMIVATPENKQGTKLFDEHETTKLIFYIAVIESVDANCLCQ